jgi:hypothetical protein
VRQLQHQDQQVRRPGFLIERFLIDRAPDQFLTTNK